MAFAFTPYVNLKAQNYANLIRIDKNQDPDSMYIMLSETAPGKYRQGKYKSVNYLNWLNTLPLGGGSDSANIFNQPVFGDRVMDLDGNDIRFENVKSFDLIGFDEGNGSQGQLRFDFATDYTVTIEAKNPIDIQSTENNVEITSGNQTIITGAYNSTLQSEGEVYVSSTGGTWITCVSNVNLSSDEGGILMNCPSDISINTSSGAISLNSNSDISVTSTTGGINLNANTYSIANLPAADGSEDSQVVIDDATGLLMAKPISGSVSSNYYEVDARLYYDPGTEQTNIDAILLNTFPGTWSIGAGGGPQTGFEFNCDDCDGTVDFTTSYPENINDFDVLIQNGYDGGNHPWMLVGYFNGGKSTGWVGYNMDGGTMSSHALDTTHYFKIHFRYYY